MLAWPKVPTARGIAPAKQKAPANCAGGETIAGYFRKVSAENPKFVRGRSNQALLQCSLEDHPGQELTN
jgi:hypothetical protein